MAFACFLIVAGDFNPKRALEKSPQAPGPLSLALIHAFGLQKEAVRVSQMVSAEEYAHGGGSFPGRTAPLIDVPQGQKRNSGRGESGHFTLN